MGDYIGIDLHKTVQEMGSGMSIDLFQMWRN